MAKKMTNGKYIKVRSIAGEVQCEHCPAYATKCITVNTVRHFRKFLTCDEHYCHTLCQVVCHVLRFTKTIWKELLPKHLDRYPFTIFGSMATLRFLIDVANDIAALHPQHHEMQKLAQGLEEQWEKLHTTALEIKSLLKAFRDTLNCMASEGIPPYAPPGCFQ